MSNPMDHLTMTTSFAKAGPQNGPRRLRSSRFRLTLLGAAAMVGAMAVGSTSPSYAGWFDDHVTHPIGKGIVNGVKAAGEVATLGEIGRQRDRERAEANEREAKIKAEDAQRQRNDRIASTRTQIATLSQMVAGLDANKKLADEAWSLHDKIVAVGQTEIAARERATADSERAADATRKSREELAGLNSALASLSYLDDQLEKSPQQEAAKEGVAQALEVARQLLRTADLDAESNGLYVDRAVRSLKTENLKRLISTSIEARSLLIGLRSNLVEQLKVYSAQLDGKQKELASL